MLYRFIPIILFLVGLLVYVGWHVWAVVPLPIWAKWTLVGIGLLCFALEFVGFTPLMDRLPLGIASAVYNIGNKTLIILCYMVMAFLLLDLGRLVHLVPRTMLHDSLPTSVVMTVLMAIIFVYAGIHYNNKKRVAIDLDSGGRTQRPPDAGDGFGPAHRLPQQACRPGPVGGPYQCREARPGADCR